MIDRKVMMLQNISILNKRWSFEYSHDLKKKKKKLQSAYFALKEDLLTACKKCCQIYLRD